MRGTEANGSYSRKVRPFDFSEEYAGALVEEVAPGIPLRILRLASLRRLKQTAGRPQDLADIAELNMLHGQGPHE